MKTLNDYLAMSNDEKFSQFMVTRFPTNRTPQYWVNWNKVATNVDKNRSAIQSLYSLVHNDNPEQTARDLFFNDPNLLKLIPVLLATREQDISVLTIDEQTKQLGHYELNFQQPDIKQLDHYLNFIRESGLFDFIRTLDSSLVDYLAGVEVGLDSNGRKNRGGTMNENILEDTLRNLVSETGWKYQAQATGSAIHNNWGIHVPEVLKAGTKGGRRYDGAVYNPDRDEVTIIETNFYGGGGSKLKAVAGEFSSLYETSLKFAHHVNFAWISDGPGWDTAQNPMREAFDVIPTIFNLQMVGDGYLHDLIRDGLNPA
jgi:type II restriction enzyme